MCMNKFLVFFYILLLLTLSQCRETLHKNNRQKEQTLIIDSLFRKYSKEKVYLSRYFTNECIKEQYDSSARNFPIDFCYLKNDLMSFMDSLDVNRCPLINHKDIIRWCEIDLHLNKIPIKADDGVTFEEIIYNIDSTRIIIGSYLKNEQQYYGSLSFKESCSLYYDIINYLMTLSKNDYDVFMANYFKYYLNHSNL